jgi:hypothetical protein
MKHAALAAFLLLSTPCLAQYGGARSGAGDALQDIGRRMQEHDSQLELMREQHRLEMERMERESALRREAAKERERAADRAHQGEFAKIELAHPGWQRTVRSTDFEAWLQRQPASVRSLTASEHASDAILLLDLYQRDRPR